MPSTFQFQIQSDMRFRRFSAFRQLASTSCLNLASFRLLYPRIERRRSYSASFRSIRAFSTGDKEPLVKVSDKPSICTADELHYVSMPNSNWRLALWRYNPPPQAPPRKHPLLLLSGVGTNAIGYDLSPESSFARYMSNQGFDTWVLEVRGAGLSVQGSNFEEIEQSAHALSEQMETVAKSAVNGAPSSQELSSSVSKHMETVDKCAVNGAPSSQELSSSSVSKHMETVDKTALKGAPPAEVEHANVSSSSLDSLQEDLTEIATMWDGSKLVTELTETFIRLSERLSGFLSEGQLKIMSAKLFDQISKLLEGSQLFERFDEIRANLSSLLEAQQNSSIVAQIRDYSQRLVNVIEESQRSYSPQLFDLQGRLFSIIENFQKQLDLIAKYDWDFDHYLEEDVPIAMEYIRALTKPKDGKLLAVGHSMGGILLYSMLSRCGFEGKEPGLAAIATLASSLDYTSSKSTLKLLLPLADPAQALNVSAVPLGVLLSATYPLSARPPYALAWLNNLISAEDMMHPELLEKLVLNNFCTIPTKLLLQLTTAFREGGLRDRSGNFFYKDHIHKTNVPVLALAGDQDLICPPEAVEETGKLFPENLITYKVFGEPQGPHYAHYDLVGGRLAVQQVYPCIIEFLIRHDSDPISSQS